jgi:hypothetical protein
MNCYKIDQIELIKRAEKYGFTSDYKVTYGFRAGFPQTNG